MTTYIRDELGEQADRDEREEERLALLGAAVVLGSLLVGVAAWYGLVWLVRAMGPERLAAAALLLLGSWLIWRALVEVDRRGR